jgi:hypothetical protein
MKTEGKMVMGYIVLLQDVLISYINDRPILLAGAR